MASEAAAARMTYAQYCELERSAASKHEYLRGEVFAMAGGTIEHGRLAARIIYLLTRELERHPCRVLSSDVRVRIETTDLATYPDASVVCGPVETSAVDPNAIVNPVALVEVPSESTEGYDRGQKASHYRRIPTLQVYVLISQHEPRVELQVRVSDERWSLVEAAAGQRLDIEPLGIALDVDELYREPALT